jgi:orotate phosphoribosyltransferase
MKDKLFNLLKSKSYRKVSEPVKLASGKFSDTFFDCKQTALTSQGHYLIGKIIFNTIEKSDFDAIAAVELGGCFIASAVSTIAYSRCNAEDFNVVIVRKAVKDHGSKRLLEGNDSLKPGSKLILLEDVVTSGGSVIKAAETLRNAGYIVDKVFCLIDRQEGGKEALQAQGLELVSLYVKSDF